jgi:MEDS: MEthanogen/methylotroph, DcmR Sensory domain
MIDAALTPSLDSGLCPHLAVLLRTDDELMPVLASFYALGAQRRGWLAHRAVRGEGARDRAALRECGLDVDGLEADGQLSIVEFDPDEAPERSTGPWKLALDEALERGYAALWYSRFAVGPEQDAFDRVLAFERAWDSSFKGRRVVTLCPYIVGALAGGPTLDRLAGVASLHDGVVIADGAGELALLRTG